MTGGQRQIEIWNKVAVEMWSAVVEAKEEHMYKRPGNILQIPRVLTEEKRESVINDVKNQLNEIVNGFAPI